MSFVNANAVNYSLAEASEAIQRAIEEVGSGVLDQSGDCALGVWLDSILTQLCLAWNRRHMSDEELLRQSQQDYETNKDRIPNLGGSFRLSPLSVVGFTNKHNPAPIKIIKEVVNQQLQSALELLDRFCYLNSTNDVVNTFEQDLAATICASIENLCLAWHLRYCSQTESDELTSAGRDDLAHSIPQWGLDYKLYSENAAI